MSSLYTVTVDAVEGSDLCGRVHVIHPDSPYVPDRITFPAALLMDAWHSLANGFLLDEDPQEVPGGDLYPFSAEHGKEIVAGMGRAGEEFAELFELVSGGRPGTPEEFARRSAAIVRSYRTGPVRDVPLWSEVVAAEAEEGRLEGAGARARAAEQGDGPADLWDERVWTLLSQREKDELPYATFEVTVTDPAYLAHLTPGMRWSTAESGQL